MLQKKTSRTIRWSFKNILTEALLFPTVSLWLKTSPRSVRAAKKLGKYALCVLIIKSRHFEMVKAGISLEHGEALSAHLARNPISGRRPGQSSGKYGKGIRQSWTLENILKTAIKYETFGAWKKNETRAFLAAKRRGFIYIVSKLLGGNQVNARASLKDLNDSALTSRADDTGARTWSSLAAEDRALYEELRSRVLKTGLVTRFGMPRGATWKDQWSERRVMAVAVRSTTMVMMERLDPGATRAAKRLGISKDIRARFFTQTKAGAKLTVGDCLDSAEQHSTFDEWLASDRQAAIRASLRGWLTECTYHFTDDFKGQLK